MQIQHSALGWWLFAIYLSCYSAFVLINAFNSQLMTETLISGINLAVWSGFGLIILAFVLSLIYGIWSVNNNKPVIKDTERGDG
jgi:uncharacterized membrane protein (DUF485 family)